MPATFAVRPLVVISIVDQVARNPGYHLQVGDIERWEAKNGKIPTGSVVMVRSDWSKEWPNADLARRKVFPGVSLAALKFLHEQRHILFHGHEPLDTDTTPTLEGEAWLLRNGYTQAEGVANLDQVAETGCLITIGYPKFAGGLGGYPRYIAICPADWKYGGSVGQVPDAPLPKSDKILSGMRPAEFESASNCARTTASLFRLRFQKFFAVSGRQLARRDSRYLTARVRATESAMKIATPTNTTSTL